MNIVKNTAKHRKRLCTKNFKKVVSEAIISIDYDELRKVLEIEFTGCKIYQYMNTDEKIWNKIVTIIKNKESLGTYINHDFKKIIEKNGYDYYELIEH